MKLQLSHRVIYQKLKLIEAGKIDQNTENIWLCDVITMQIKILKTLCLLFVYCSICRRCLTTIGRFIS